MTRRKPSRQAWRCARAITVLLPGLVATQAAAGVPAIVATQSMPPPADLFNLRYCEVIPVFRDGVTLNVEVYNTISLNDCPAAAWKQLNAAKLAKELDATRVKLNGPRYWLMNRIEGGGASVGGKTADFGGIQMRQVATLKMKLWQASAGDQPYAEQTVQRTTVWIFFKGTKIFELKGPSGDVYVMQSYAQSVDPTLNLQSLEGLGTRLKLPKGWTYGARVLTQDLSLKADGIARIVQDDLQNTYQKIPAGP